MIKRQSHSTVYVIDQQEALKFYRDKLGFEVRTDLPMNDEGSVRWLTVSPKDSESRRKTAPAAMMTNRMLCCHGFTLSPLGR